LIIAPVGPAFGHALDLYEQLATAQLRLHELDDRLVWKQLVE
jgi:hypothetical protein